MMMMMKVRRVVELAPRELFCARVMKIEYYYRYENGVHSKVRRSPRAIRQLIEGRKTSKCYGETVCKYELMKKAFDGLERAMSMMEYGDLMSAHYNFEAALKFQGYLQLQLIIAEKRCEGKTDTEIKNMLMGEML
jgi:hypothetical protein